MIQRISNGNYCYQNIGNTSDQMYNARPIFAGQVQPNTDTVQFSSPKKEGSFIENNIGKILIGAGLLAVLFATHGKGAKAVEETTPHLPPLELPPHTPPELLDDGLKTLGSAIDDQVDDVATSIGNTSTKLSEAEKNEIKNFLAINKGVSSDYLKLQQTKAITNAALSPEETVKQEKLYRIAIRKAERAEREAATKAETSANAESNAAPKRKENTTPVFEPTLSQWEQSRESFARYQSRILPEKYEYYLRYYEQRYPRPKD